MKKINKAEQSKKEYEQGLRRIGRLEQKKQEIMYTDKKFPVFN